MLLLFLLTSSQCLKKYTKPSSFKSTWKHQEKKTPNLKPAQYQTDTKNMQLADACLVSRGSTGSPHPQGHWHTGLSLKTT